MNLGVYRSFLSPYYAVNEISRQQICDIFPSFSENIDICKKKKKKKSTLMG